MKLTQSQYDKEVEKIFNSDLEPEEILMEYLEFAASAEIVKKKGKGD